MATRNLKLGGGSGPKEVDLVDVAALMLLPIAASMIFGVFSLSINVFGGYDFTQPIWSIGGTNISAALLVTAASVAWIAGTNLLNSDTEFTQVEMAVTGTAIALPVIYVFVPAVADLVEWHDLTQLAAVLYVSAASVYVSYVG